MFQKITIFILSFFLIVLPIYTAYKLYALDRVYFLCPIEYRQDTIILRHDAYGSGDFLAGRSGSRKHNGIDLRAKIGTPVYAARSGRVSEARFHNGLGNYVELAHRGGYTTIYAHLSKIDVKEGRFVRQGEKIGEVGKSGNANYRGIIPHLHLEVRRQGEPLDPMQFLE